MRKIVNIHEAKTHLSRLLNELGPEDEILLARAGQPVARIVPLQPAPTERTLGFLKGNVPESFFEPLPEAELGAWESSG